MTRHAPTTAELIAQEAIRLRPHLIRTHHHAARREDLEDLYSQTMLELLARAQRDPTLNSAAHIRAALRQKFEARIVDHHRAAAGRSPAAAAREHAQQLDDITERLATHRDPAADLANRETMREVLAAWRQLTDDQRLVITSQLRGEQPRDCCARAGWSLEKYRKVAQRSRARLTAATSRADPSSALHDCNPAPSRVSRGPDNNAVGSADDASDHDTDARWAGRE
jgi:hypothetical protein